MARISSNLKPGVKARLAEMKIHLNLKNESQVVGYLLGLYDINYEKLTVVENQLCLEISKQLNSDE